MYLLFIIFGIILYLLNNIEKFSIGVPTDFSCASPTIEEVALVDSSISQKKKIEIMQYYDLYKLFTKLSIEYQKFEELNFVLTSPGVLDLIIEKGFEVNMIRLLYFVNAGGPLIYHPILLECVNIHTQESFHLLNLFPGNKGNVNNFHSLSITIKNLLDEHLPMEKLIIVGHSSGAALLLTLVNYFIESRIMDSITHLMCITTGLGLCDSIVVDTFESNVIDFNIKHYDIMNFGGLPINEDCWEEHYIDGWLINITMVSKYCDPNSPNFTNLCNKLLEVNFTDIDYQNILRELEYRHSVLVNAVIEDRNVRITAGGPSIQLNLPSDYLHHYDTIQENMRVNIEKCLSNININNCYNLYLSLHKHLTRNTFAIIPSISYSKLYSYNKNTLLNIVLHDGNWILDTSGLYTSIMNNGNKLCFSYDSLVPKGAHRLDSYHENLYNMFPQ